MDGTDTFFDFGISKIKDVVNKMPTVDADPVRHGSWDAGLNIDNEPLFTCSVCKRSFCGPEDYIEEIINYCPNCGAKMDGGEE
jgi:hypothetical protein